MKATGIVDADVREALDALTRTYRSLSSGIYYDTRPVNPYADGIYTAVQASIAELQEEAKKESTSVRDAELLGVLVMYQRLAMTYDNGRPKGRAFIDNMRGQFSIESTPPAPASRLIEL